MLDVQKLKADPSYADAVYAAVLPVVLDRVLDDVLASEPDDEERERWDDCA